MNQSDESQLLAPLPERSRLMRWLKQKIPNPRLSFSTRESRRQFDAYVHRMTSRSGAKLLNVGSKSARLGVSVFNLDIYTYPGVHVVGDGHSLPFTDRSVDGVIITSVLEHVAVPQAVVGEIERVLKPGGEVYVEVPFIRPFHPDPEDYQRYSLTGLEQLFRDFVIVEKGMCVGPSSGLASILSQYVALMLCFNNRYLYKVLSRLCRLPFAPLILLDAYFQRIPYSVALASSYFLIGSKRSG